MKASLLDKVLFKQEKSLNVPAEEAHVGRCIRATPTSLLREEVGSHTHTHHTRGNPRQKRGGGGVTSH